MTIFLLVGFGRAARTCIIRLINAQNGGEGGATPPPSPSLPGEINDLQSQTTNPRKIAV
jgi:hypothetical protein